MFPTIVSERPLCKLEKREGRAYGLSGETLDENFRVFVYLVSQILRQLDSLIRMFWIVSS